MRKSDIIKTLEAEMIAAIRPAGRDGTSEARLLVVKRTLADMIDKQDDISTPLGRRMMNVARRVHRNLPFARIHDAAQRGELDGVAYADALESARVADAALVD